MPGPHNQGPNFQGCRHPPGFKAALGVAHFGGTYGTTTQSAAPSGLRQPFGVFGPGEGQTAETNRGVWDVAYQLVMDFIPAGTDNTLLAASQSPGASPLVLRGSNVAGANTPSAPALTLVRDPLGVIRRRLDTPRCVSISSTGDDTGITFAVRGFDEYNQAMTEVITGANAGLVNGKKAFFDVVSITPSGAVAAAVTVGQTRRFGLPYCCDRYAMLDVYGNDIINLAVGLTAADRTTATGTTGDVRGIFNLTQVPNGTLAVQIFQVVPQAANSDLTRVYGVPQFSG